MTILPLLQRELSEKGAQSRTYILRVVYALLLYGGAWLVFGDELMPADPTRAGSGREVFRFVVACSFAAVYLLIPAGLGTVLLRERQRGTYDLLVLAGMSARRILAEILLSGLLPLVTVLLIAAPLLAVAYGRGGVEDSWLPLALAGLVCAALQAGAVSLYASTKVADPGKALLGAYVRVFLQLGLAVPLLCGIVIGIFIAMLGAVGAPSGIGWLAVGSLPPALFFAAADTATPLSWSLFGLLPALVTVWYFLLLTLDGLRTWRRHGAPRDEDRYLVRAWRGKDLPRRMGDALVDGPPIAWRERSRLLLAIGSKPLAVALAVGFLGLLLSLSIPGRGQHEFSSLVAGGLWLILALGLVLGLVDAYASEHDSGAWAVLLTTPLPGPSIIWQKLEVARSLLKWCGGALVSLWVIEWVKEDAWLHLGGWWWLPVQGAALMVFTAGVALIATLAGLHGGSRVRSVSVALIAVAGWCMLPVGAVSALPRSAAEWLPLASPAVVIGVLEYQPRHTLHAALGVLVNAAIIGGGWCWLLYRPDRHLGRG